MAVELGGHIRIGLEDNIHISDGVLAKSNKELVERIKRLAQDAGREIATPDQARKILGLKGKNRVDY
jgi:3-keto-5-aminohexanoate cleavage enzyme